MFTAVSDSPTDPLLGSRRARRRFASVEAAAIAGIVSGIGWALAMWGLLSRPGVGASNAEIREYYADTSNSTTAFVWLQVLVVSTIAFLWFVGVIRGRIGEREPRLFGTVFFGSAVLLAVLVFVGAALLAAPSVLVAVGDRQPDPEVAAMMRSAAAVVLGVFAPRVATLVMFSTASLGRATGALPRWLVWATYAVGAYEFVNVSVDTPSLLVVPAWIVVVSVELLVRRPSNGFELAPVSTDG